MRGHFCPLLGQFAGPRDTFTFVWPPHLDKQRRAARKGRWELEVVVTHNSNRSADVLYSTLLNETLGVVMWTVVLFVICLAASSLNAPLSHK